MADYQILVSVAMDDYLGVRTSHDIFVKAADTVTLATLATQIGTYQQLLDPITGSVIREVTARVFLPLDAGNKTSAVAGDENEKTGLFNFSQTGSTYRYGVDVPGLAETLITNGRIDLSNAGLQAWIAWFTAAHSGIQAVSKFTLILVDLLDALITFRKHRKAENRRSIVTP